MRVACDFIAQDLIPSAACTTAAPARSAVGVVARPLVVWVGRLVGLVDEIERL